jgi:hypothetical protein
VLFGGEHNGVPDLAAEALQRARGLVERGWCQRESARDATGKPVEPWSPAAARWSAAGAMDVAWRELSMAGRSPEIARSAFERAELALAVVLGEQLVEWNDAPARTQAEVVDTFAQALDRAEKLHRRLVQSGTVLAVRDDEPAPSFDERRQELERFLGDFTQELRRRGVGTATSSSESTAGNGDSVSSLIRRLERGDSPLRQNIQLLSSIMLQQTELRLRMLAAIGSRLSQQERDGLAGVLRKSSEERRTLAALLRLDQADREELAAMLGLSDSECQALTFLLAERT